MTRFCLNEGREHASLNMTFRTDRQELKGEQWGEEKKRRGHQGANLKSFGKEPKDIARKILRHLKVFLK